MEQSNASMLSLGLGGCNLSSSNSCGLHYLLHHPKPHRKAQQGCRQPDRLSLGCHASTRAFRMCFHTQWESAPSHLCRHEVTWDPVNLADLQEALDRKKLNANELITMKTLRDAGIASKKIEFGVKLLAKVCPPACDS